MNMKKVVAVLAVALGGVAYAETGGTVDGEAGAYAITVAKDAEYTVTADDVAAAAGLALAKRGEGTLIADAVMAGFAGEIRIEEGFYRAIDPGALGTADGGTVVSNNAALHVSYGTKDKLIFKNEAITLAGAGPDGKGALFHQYYDIPNKKYLQQNCLLKSGGSIILSADATVGGVYNLGFGGGTLYLEGHTLSVRMTTNSQPLDLSFGSIVTAGDIDVVKGRLFLDDATTSFAGSSANTVRVASGNQLAFRGTTVPIPYSLILDGDVTLYPSQGSGLTDGQNEWAGPVTLNGKAKVDYDSKPTGVHISGPVSGTGSFAVANTNSLRLSNSGNTFSGGVDISNTSFDANGTLCGLYVDADGAVPVDGTEITNHLGSIIFRGGNMTLPPVHVSSGAVLSNACPGTVVRIPSLSKWGAKTLEVSGGIALTNRLYGGKGLVRLSGYEPGTCVAGLKRAHQNFDTAKELTDYCKNQVGVTLSKSLKPSEARKIFTYLRKNVTATTEDCAESAYRAWTTAETYSLESYWGYFRNNEPTNVTVTFATSIADTAALWVDSQNIILNVGSKKTIVDGISKTYFVTLGEVTLAPGAHTFDLLFGHYDSTTKGPRPADYSKSGLKWGDLLGLAFRYGALDLSAPTNSADYAAVKNDAGFGTLLTTENLPIASDLTEHPELYRPSFASLAFGKAENSCALDLGQTAGYPAYETGDLSGVCILSNGTLNVNGDWTIAKPASLSAGPLTVAAGAGLCFAEGCTFRSDDLRAFKAGSAGVTLATVEEDGTLTGVPAVAEGWEIRREASDLRLYRTAGAVLILR